MKKIKLVPMCLIFSLMISPFTQVLAVETIGTTTEQPQTKISETVLTFTTYAEFEEKIQEYYYGSLQGSGTPPVLWVNLLDYMVGGDPEMIEYMENYFKGINVTSNYWPAMMKDIQSKVDDTWLLSGTIGSTATIHLEKYGVTIDKSLQEDTEVDVSGTATEYYMKDGIKETIDYDTLDPVKNSDGSIELSFSEDSNGHYLTFTRLTESSNHDLNFDLGETLFYFSFEKDKNYAEDLEGNIVWIQGSFSEKLSLGSFDFKNMVFITDESNLSSLLTKDIQLNLGEEWNPNDNLESVLNLDGEPVKWISTEDNGLTVEGGVDTSQPGEYLVTFYYKDPNFTNNNEPLKGTARITVLADYTDVLAHDGELYEGDVFDASVYFDGAKDKEGAAIPFEEVKVTGTVDSTKAGVYPVIYSYGGKEITVNITVLKDNTSVSAHDGELYEGDVFDASVYFDGAKDKEGNNLPFSEITVMGEVDINTPGNYLITYSYGNFSEIITIVVLEKEEVILVEEPSEDSSESISEDSLNTASSNENEIIESEQKLPQTNEKPANLLLLNGLFICLLSGFLIGKRLVKRII